jgi:hypothetical protein
MRFKTVFVMATIFSSSDTAPLNSASIVLLITPFHGSHRKHCLNSNSIAACVPTAMGTCLTSCCLETVLVYLLISWSLHSNSSTCYNIIGYRGELQGEDNHTFYSSPYIIRMTKSRMRWVWNVACMGGEEKCT